jgi:hypothetical protein
MKKLLGVFVVVMAVWMIVGLYRGETTPAPVETPERVKLELEQTRAVDGANALRAAVRDPESFALQSAHVKPDGSICYVFKAKNGFGGTTQEFAVFPPGELALTQKLSVWNARCAHKLGDDQTAQVISRMGGL